MYYHVGQCSQITPTEASISVSLNTLAMIYRASRIHRQALTVLLFCAVFPTTTKDSSTISLDTLAEICQAVEIPVVAIGGITADNAAATMKAGCAGVAVVSAIFGADDPATAAQALLASVDRV